MLKNNILKNKQNIWKNEDSKNDDFKLLKIHTLKSLETHE